MSTLVAHGRLRSTTSTARALLGALAALTAAQALLASAARAQCGPRESAVIDSPAPAAGARFGEALALFGELLAVGAPREAALAPDAGAVHLLMAPRRGDEQGWLAAARLVASDGASGDRFGAALDSGGRLLAIGAPGSEAGRGAVYLFGSTGGAWLELAKLRAAGGLAGAHFGGAVALSGERLLVGAPEAATGGAAYLYERDSASGAWLERARWGPPAVSPGAAFGASLDLEGPWALVGAPAYAAPDAPSAATGALFAFERGAAGWSARGALYPGYAAPLEVGDAFGASVCLAGGRALAGVPGRDADGSGTDSGAALLFARGAAPSGWITSGVLVPLAPQADELFGERVALGGSTALIGAPDSAEGGAVYVLRAEPGTGAWIQSARLVASDGGQRYGAALALAARTGVAGAPAKDLPGLPSAGGSYALAGLDELPPLPYCSAGTSSQGCRAMLSSEGLPSASAQSGFTVLARGADGAALGIFLYGTHGRASLPFGGASTLCIAPPLTRTPAQAGRGARGTCFGTFALDLNAYWAGAPLAAPGAGAVVQVQLWYRGAAAGSAGTLSDALELSLCP